MSLPNLEDCCTLSDVARKVGSYSQAYTLAASGILGEPIAKVGRSSLYSCRVVDAALADRAAKRKAATQGR